MTFELLNKLGSHEQWYQQSWHTVYKSLQSNTSTDNGWCAAPASLYTLSRADLGEFRLQDCGTGGKL